MAVPDPKPRSADGAVLHTSVAPGESTVPDRQNTRQRFAGQLWKLAELEQAASTRRSFRARAYRAAVWSLDELTPELSEPISEMTAISGIGPGIASLVAEFRELGALRRLDQLGAAYPIQSSRLRRLPRMTPRLLERLKKEAAVDTVEDLATAISAGTLDIQGVGDKTLTLWEGRLDLLRETAIFDDVAFASRLGRHIQRHTGARVEITGSMRRFDEEIDLMELLLVGGDGVTTFVTGSALVQGSSVQPATVLLDTLGGDVLAHLAEPENAGTAWVLTTGPEDHLAMLRTLREGPWPASPTEPGFYSALGIEPVPPPARSGDLPAPGQLVDQDMVRGDLHLHSDWSPDGRQTLEDLVSEAKTQGLEYIAVTDHAIGLRFGGLTQDRILEQHEEIERLREAEPTVRIFHGAELNIALDGSLDYPDDILALLDFRLASVHSHFDLDSMTQTERVIRAIGHPLVHVIAHPTGRRIGRRPSLSLDLTALIQAAIENNTALEVNGHLDRLDLGSDHAAAAGRYGALLAADSDAHRSGEMANVANSVAVLQRARVQPGQVINTWDTATMVAWLASKS
jgi:DNA polymerase (family 10)